MLIKKYLLLEINAKCNAKQWNLIHSFCWAFSSVVFGLSSLVESCSSVWVRTSSFSSDSLSLDSVLAGSEDLALDSFGLRLLRCCFFFRRLARFLAVFCSANNRFCSILLRKSHSACSLNNEKVFVENKILPKNKQMRSSASQVPLRFAVESVFVGHTLFDVDVCIREIRHCQLQHSSPSHSERMMASRKHHCRSDFWTSTMELSPLFAANKNCHHRVKCIEFWAFQCSSTYRIFHQSFQLDTLYIGWSSCHEFWFLLFWLLFLNFFVHFRYSSVNFKLLEKKPAQIRLVWYLYLISLCKWYDSKRQTWLLSIHSHERQLVFFLSLSFHIQRI